MIILAHVHVLLANLWGLEGALGGPRSPYPNIDTTSWKKNKHWAQHGVVLVVFLKFWRDLLRLESYWFVLCDVGGLFSSPWGANSYEVPYIAATNEVTPFAPKFDFREMTSKCYNIYIYICIYTYRHIMYMSIYRVCLPGQQFQHCMFVRVCDILGC